jgi:hypothetical protein
MIKSLKEEISKALPKSDMPQADLEKFLMSDKLDAQLVKFNVISHATPHGLAEFAQQGQEQESLVDKLLADTALMKQMVVADGAAGRCYGQAMKIYTDIQKVSTNAKDGVLQRFSVAVSIEHAASGGQSNPKDQTNPPINSGPVKRYLHFEKAYLDGELDPGFKDMTVWDYRNVCNGEEPDEMLAWGREMLQNYNPDHVRNPDYRWRYVESVKTDVKYGSKDQQNDIPSLHGCQNIINTGGVCGRRAGFGRYILRCFGIPTLARPQVGHASLVHWTPKGWVICLGATWGFGKVRGVPDTEFLAITQLRMSGDAYLQVLRAQWISAALGESGAAPNNFWNVMAGNRQHAIIEKAKAETLAAVGTDIGEANESKVKDVLKTVTMTEEDKKTVVAQDGTVTIPAVACSSPTTNTEKIRFMKSYKSGSGMQLHYCRLGQKPETFEYTFDAPAAGKYLLSALVVTLSPDQHLLVSANDAKETVDITAPYTIGKWGKTPSVEVSLVKGKNMLRFARGGENIKGLTIKDFTLTPVK